MAKKISQVQDSLITQDSFDYNLTDTIIIDDNRRSQLFSFGSSTLAIIYMANTMVIPSMNQLQTEIDFSTTQSLAISVFCYWLLMLTILIPCYLVIQVCKKEQNPIFANIIKQESPMMQRLFIYSNLIINALGLFNIVMRLAENIPKIQPNLHQLYQEGIKTGYGQIIFIFYSALLFFIIYKISYFEHYNEIQFRLLITFIGKWAIQITIFLMIYFEDVETCQNPYLTPDDNLLNKGYDFDHLMFYLLNVFSCVSYPFFEVFYVKRETKAGYEKVQQCYWFQLAFRLMYFFQQVTLWGLLNYQNKIICFYQYPIQILNCTLILLVCISIGPIYAHNYTLNKEIQDGTIWSATEKDNRRQIKEIYIVSVAVLVGIIVVSLFCNDTNAMKYELYDLTYSVFTICFGFSCIAMPVYVYMVQQFKFGAYAQIIIVMSAFILICSQPLYKED